MSLRSTLELPRLPRELSAQKPGVTRLRQAVRAMLCVLGLCATSVSAYAACTTTYCNAVTVTKLYVNANHRIYVGTSGDESALSCPAVADVYLSLELDAINYDPIYATLLAARLSGSTVSIVVTSGTGGCEITYMTL